MIFSWKQGFSLLLRFGFGLLLLIASIDKMMHPFEFAQAVENYRVVGEGMSYWVAVWLPYLEASIGLFLILGLWMDAATLMNALLMILFLFMVAQAYIRHLDIRCGCFTVQGEASSIGIWKIMQNGLFAGLSILLVWLANNPKNAQRNHGESSERSSRSLSFMEMGRSGD